MKLATLSIVLLLSACCCMGQILTVGNSNTINDDLSIGSLIDRSFSDMEGSEMTEQVTTEYATDKEIETARRLYQTTDIEIDDYDVRTSRVPGEGVWIAAWVWLPTEEEEQ